MKNNGVLGHIADGCSVLPLEMGCNYHKKLRKKRLKEFKSISKHPELMFKPIKLTKAEKEKAEIVKKLMESVYSSFDWDRSRMRIEFLKEENKKNPYGSVKYSWDA